MKELRELRVWWPTSPAPGNLGDILTPVLLRHFGIRAVWTDQPTAELLCVGSIIRFARPGQRILGSGAMWAKDAPDPRAEYLAVRGPRTRELVLQAGGDCPPVFGDPALLLPSIWHPKVPKKYAVGIVPHYIDRDWVTVALPSSTRIINVLRTDPLEVVRDILECRAILSSSLHGLIVAHAYGIPAAWVRFGDLLSGDDTKFADYAESVGIHLRPYERIEDAVPVLPALPDLDPLREAFRCL